MTIIKQEPHKLDSNVTIKVPEKIEISYSLPHNGWLIFINDKAVSHVNSTFKVFKDVSEATNWLIERSLLKTVAYNELDKTVRKAVNGK